MKTQGTRQEITCKWYNRRGEPGMETATHHTLLLVKIVIAVAVTQHLRNAHRLAVPRVEVDVVPQALHLVEE
jgi:hypothetical protein